MANALCRISRSKIFVALIALSAASCGSESNTAIDEDFQAEVSTPKSSVMLYTIPSFIEVTPGHSTSVTVIRETKRSGFSESCETESEDLILEWDFSNELDVNFDGTGASFSFKGEGQFEIVITDLELDLQTTATIRYTNEPTVSFPIIRRTCD